MKKIYYIGEFRFPDGEAASYRVLGNALALHGTEYDVVVVGRREAGAAFTPDGNIAGVYFFALLDYFAHSKSIAARVARYLSRGLRLVRWLQANAKNDAAAIILAGGYSRYLLLLIPMTRLWNIPLIVDVVEWYEPEHCVGGRFGPQRLDVEATLRLLVPFAGNAIAISSFLEMHFNRHGVKTLRVPPLIDMQDPKWNAKSPQMAGGKLRLSFVGNAGKKDFLVNAIRGLALLGDSAQHCEIIIVGPSPQEVRNNLGAEAGMLDGLGSSLRFTGRLPHIEALQQLMLADFSILLRPDARYAHAGFPTKLVESFAMGVPVICNLTSDIGLYVCDGHEGIVVSDCSAESFAAGVRRALAMSQDERAAMRRHARKRAESSFDYRNYTTPFGSFMKQVLSGSR